MKEQQEQQKSAQIIVKALFIIRVCLWIVGLIPTIYWIYYSFKLTSDGIFDPFEYADYLRPVLYPCLVITFAALCISFALHAISNHIKEKHGLK